jgi:hypothetical protein
VIVFVVPSERLEVVKALLGGSLVGVAQEVELQLARHHDVESQLAGSLHLAAEHGTRGHRNQGMGGFILDIGEHQRGFLQPGDDAEGGPVRGGEVVAIARLPAHQPVTRRRPHLHIGAEQVGTEVGAVPGVLQEEVAGHPLAHEPALKVGDGTDDGVDRAVANA